METRAHGALLERARSEACAFDWFRHLVDRLGPGHLAPVQAAELSG